MKVIVACAGSSSRFPNMAPKWMLPDHDGQPMIVQAIAGLNAPIDDLIVTILRDHDERFNAAEGLRRAFGDRLNCVILDQPTRSQSETVAETLRQTALNEPFLVKDSDNYFELPRGLEVGSNYVSVASLNDFDNINARNKSYVQVNQEDLIVNMREKQVISDLFSVGGYFFQRPEEFLAAYDELSATSTSELYISNIIGFMVLNGHAFKARKVERYQDWGTVHEWRQRLEQRRVFMVSVDGFLFERGSRFFAPLFEEVKPHPNAVAVVEKMVRDHTLIYLSIRPPELEAMTRAQIASLGLPDGQIIFGCGVAQWTLVTSGHSSLPFTTSRAFEVDPDDVNLADKLDLA